ncbi:MAG: cysteine desulfurase [Candidatus Dojkabacteria bacterium]|nr:cysteine desulfurase [Candidatus Dojkabacteria bacterium]
MKILIMKKNNKNNIKKQFPIFKQKINGNPLIYLDSAATTQKPQDVIDCIEDYYSKYNSNIHRSAHQLARKATEKWIEAHEIIADFLNAKSYKEIIFLRNCTEGINLFVNTYGKQNLKKGDYVIISEMEHHSNIVPWQILQKEIDFNIEYIPINSEYRLDLDWLKKRADELKDKLKIISVVHISNVLGTVNDIKEITSIAHSVGAVSLVDAAQSVARLKIDVQNIDCDALVFSGHKIYGPTGSGAIYVKEKILEKMPPYMGGGEMIREVHKDSFSLNELPWRYEAGTPNIADGIALGEAIEWFNKTVTDLGGYERLVEHEKSLINRFLSNFEEMEWFKLFGSKERLGVITFNIDGFSFSGCKKGTVESNKYGEEIINFLSSKGLCIRDGFHCAQPLHERFDKGPTLRVSLGIYSDEADIDRAVKLIKEGVLRVM